MDEKRCDHEPQHMPDGRELPCAECAFGEHLTVQVRLGTTGTSMLRFDRLAITNGHATRYLWVLPEEGHNG